MRASAVAVIALVCAFLGATGALVVGKATGWVDGEAATVVVRERESGAAPAARIERGSEAKPLPGNDFDAAEIYRERAAGVVTVISLFGDHAETGGGEAAQGSGFVVSDEGYILTNSHVITNAGERAAGETPEPASEVYVEFRDGEREEAKIVGWDLFDDVGVLKVAADAHRLRPVPIGDSASVVVGEPVAAIGSPFGQINSLSVGVVAATERSIDSLTSRYSLVDAIQTDAPINRGNSGGPLLDARGRAIGVNAQIRSESGTAEGVGFAVPINSAVRSMEQLIREGRVRYAWVGVSTQTVTPSLARRFGFATSRGAAIQSVVDESPADAAGLRAGGEKRSFAGLLVAVGGDVIVAIDGEPVESAEDVVRAVTRRLPGESARFSIVRGERRLTLDVKLAERPANPPPLE
ncbi:MAG: trypsin-like peptidase domain-containing protein [Thermoleophilia bacterium]|nr:trypsin-like peptidase domain-containing protein [Thermoleophilia bacterium]